MSESALNSSGVQDLDDDIRLLFQEFEQRCRTLTTPKCECEKKNQALHDHIKTFTQKLMTVVLNFEKQVKRKQNGSSPT